MPSVKQFKEPAPKCASQKDPPHISSLSASPGLGEAYRASDGCHVNETRVVQVKKELDVDNPRDDPPAYVLVGPKGYIAQVDLNKQGLGDDDPTFAKLLCDTMVEAQPELRNNKYLTGDVLMQITMNSIRDVRALDMPYEDQPREIIHRLKGPMVQALREAKASELEHADNEAAKLTNNSNGSPTTSLQEEDSEDTESSEETTAGFIIDIWWSALRECNKDTIRNLACAPDNREISRKKKKASYDKMAFLTDPTVAGVGRTFNDDDTEAAAPERSYLPNIWRDTTKDEGPSETTSPAPKYPRVPFTPITYDPRDFPMLRPIQHFTDAQVQAIKGATAEAEKKEGSQPEHGK